MNFRKPENILPLFFFIGTACHGIFFVREWLVLGVLFIVFFLVFFIVTWDHLAFPDLMSHIQPNIFFLTLIILSLAGLLWPVRSIEGWLESLRWVIYWVAYLWGTRLADTEYKDRILIRIVWVTLICVLFSWLPGSEKIWIPPAPPENSRYAFCFGYPNTAAAFLFFQIMVLYLYRGKMSAFFTAFVPVIWGIFIISILFTGSRASIFLFLCLLTVIMFKKAALQKRLKKRDPRCQRGQGRFGKRILKAGVEVGVGLVFLLFFFCLMLQDHQNAIVHLLNWTNTSLTERIVYFLDSIRLAWDAHLLPRAGGWLAFPFVQTIPYWTLDPHSSLCHILLDQGLPGAAIVLLWAGKGIRQYIRDLLFGEEMDVIITRTAALYLGLHSLIDADMLFGIVGILFWLVIGMNSQNSIKSAAYHDSD